MEIEKQVEKLIGETNYTHEVDWDKVNGVKEIKEVLSAILGAVDPSDEDIKKISHLLKKR